MSPSGQNEPCHSLRRHGRSTSVSGPAGLAVGTSGSGQQGTFPPSRRTKDDRVGPQHARKFAARLEEMKLPFFYYENTEGGHGAGADLKQTAHTTALTMTYLQRKLMD